MPRKPTPTPIDADDSAALHDAIQSVIDDMGRGGLSYVADRIGVSPSMLQKRLKRPGKAFDAPTIRAALLILEIRSEPTSEAQPPEPETGNEAQASQVA